MDSPCRFGHIAALLTIEFEHALVSEAWGCILPRQAMPNEDTWFTYMAVVASQ